jgi:hypothetical protein
MLEAVRSVDFDTQISCIKCGQEGSVTWTRDVAPHLGPVAVTSPVKTSDGFYLRVNASPSSNPHIVCARCGTLHRDRVA